MKTISQGEKQRFYENVKLSFLAINESVNHSVISDSL